MRAVDKLLAGYLGFVTIVIVARGWLDKPDIWGLLVMHALVGLLLYLFYRLQPTDRIGQVLHDLYPLLLLLAFYAEFGVLNGHLDPASIYARDATVQGWEAALFGGQISYDWIRNSPSVLWSGILHLAYFSYYPIVVLGPVILVARGRRSAARRVLLVTMIAFVACYVFFVLYPVAGPNYAFEHPTGPVREVWSARLVYGILSGGSSFGAAFPSSHVAATAAATLSMWREWRSFAVAFAVPAVLLVIGTIYCQMHYGVDVIAGLAVGVGAVWVGYSISDFRFPISEVTRDPSDISNRKSGIA